MRLNRLLLFCLRSSCIYFHDYSIQEEMCFKSVLVSNSQLLKLCLFGKPFTICPVFIVLRLIVCSFEYITSVYLASQKLHNLCRSMKLALKICTICVAVRLAYVMCKFCILRSTEKCYNSVVPRAI